MLNWNLKMKILTTLSNSLANKWFQIKKMSINADL